MPHNLCRTYCRPKQGLVFEFGGEKLRLGGKLGDGAVGVVRKAWRISDDAPRAIKFLAPDPKYIEESSFNDVAARFAREGVRGSQLDHPHLVKVHAFVENPDGQAFSAASAPKNPFLCLEWVKGRSLESFIRGLPSPERGVFMPTERRLEIAIQVTEALEYLHRRQIVHRDVKPANIFIGTPSEKDSPTVAKLGDFGVVKWGDFQASMATGVLTVTNQQGLGTLKYMAPEQALNPKGVGVRSDVFSLGITLLELFSGQILSTHHHVFSVMSARMTRNTTTPGRFQSIGVDLPFEFADIGELLLDMHLRGAIGRPSTKKVLGHLRYLRSALFPQA